MERQKVDLINVALPRKAHKLLNVLAEEDRRSLANELAFLIEKEEERRANAETH